jgi:hypothetical protein
MLKKIALLGTAILVMGSKISTVESSTPAFAVSVTPVEREITLHDDIILLPKLVVRPPESPALGEREIYTDKGLDELLLKRFPGASFKNQPKELDNYARLMYAEEVRLARLNHFKEVASVLRATGDVAGSKELRAEIYQTFIRRPTWREEAMDRNVNRNRR